MSKELLFSVKQADCDYQTFHAGGPGGQKQNKSSSGVRYVHRPSGAVGESREERSQLQNRHNAWKRMAEHPKMKVWIAAEVFRLSGNKTPEQLVTEMMEPANLKVEKKIDGKWAPMIE
jgi:protein subunit release factor B